MTSQTIVTILKENLNCREISLLTSQHYHTDRGDFFVKTGHAIDADRLTAEAIALKALENTKTIRVPHPYSWGIKDKVAYSIVEFLDLTPHSRESQEKLGRDLAQLHLVKGPSQFGFEIDNTIGLTPQENPWTESWSSFFAIHRLQYQMDKIQDKYNDDSLANRVRALIDCLPQFFSGLSITPSLLHGDLWSGNTGALTEGTPVVYDPASYWGHHEADLSMMGMFGGFSSHFFEAYHEIIPKEPGSSERIKIYSLYHYLNHYLLFGGGYRPSCLFILNTLL